MSRMRKLCFLSFLILPLFSCTVLWENPNSDVVNADIDEQLPGAWVNEDRSGVVYISKPVNGWMIFFSGKRGNTKEGVFGKMYVTKMSGRSFLNVKICDFNLKDFSDYYCLAEYRIEGKNKLWVFFTEGRIEGQSFVRDSIEDGTLQGRMEELPENGPDVVYCPSSEIRRFIRDSPMEKLFSVGIQPLYKIR